MRITLLVLSNDSLELAHNVRHRRPVRRILSPHSLDEVDELRAPLLAHA